MLGVVLKTGTHHYSAKVFIQKDLQKSSHAFERNDSVRPPLQPPHDGPFKIIEKFDKYFKCFSGKTLSSNSTCRRRVSLTEYKSWVSEFNSNSYRDTIWSTGYHSSEIPLMKLEREYCGDHNI